MTGRPGSSSLRAILEPLTFVIPFSELCDALALGEQQQELEERIPTPQPADGAARGRKRVRFDWSEPEQEEEDTDGDADDQATPQERGIRPSQLSKKQKRADPEDRSYRCRSGSSRTDAGDDDSGQYGSRQEQHLVVLGRTRSASRQSTRTASSRS